MNGFYDGEVLTTENLTSGIAAAVNDVLTAPGPIGSATPNTLNGIVTATGSTNGRSLAARFADVVNVLDFTGADPTGTTDSSAALVAAIAAASTAGGKGVLLPGTFMLGNSTAINVPAGVVLIGEGPYFSKLLFSNATTNGLYFAGNGSGSRGVGFGAASGVTMTSGQFVTLAGTNQVFEDFQISGDILGINMATSAACKVARGTFSAGVPGGVRILVNTGDGSPTISDILANAQSGTQPAAGIRVVNATAATITRTSMIQQGHGLDLVPTGSGKVLDLRVSNSLFDSGSIGLNIAPTTGGAVERISLTSCWAGDASANGINIVNDGSSSIGGIRLVNQEACVNALSGLYSSGAVTDLSIIGGIFAQNQFGIDASHTGALIVLGAKAGAYEGLPGNSQYGMSLAASLTSISISNVSLKGNTSGSIQDLNTSAVPKFISNVDESAYAKSGTITVGASPFTYTAPFDQTIYLSSGTITNIVINGIDVFNSVPSATVCLRRGETVEVVYTAAPYMFFSA